MGGSRGGVSHAWLSGTGFQAAWGGRSRSEGDSTVLSEGQVPGHEPTGRQGLAPHTMGPVSILSGRRAAICTKHRLVDQPSVTTQ